MMTLTSAATAPNMVTLGFSLSTSSSRTFRSLPINFDPITTPLSFCSSRSRFLGKVELLSATPRVDHNNKTTAFAQALKVVKAVDSVAATSVENETVRDSVTPVRRKVFKQERNPKRLNSSASPRNTLDHYQILMYPLRSEAAIKNIANNNTLVFVVDKRADKKNIRQAAEEMLKIQIRKINTALMPDGTKKAYLMLKPNSNANDIAKKIGVF